MDQGLRIWINNLIVYVSGFYNVLRHYALSLLELTRYFSEEFIGLIDGDV